MNTNKIILDLCGGTGAWSRPYFEAGYDVRNITLPSFDVRLYVPPLSIYGVLAAPPCTHLAASGAQWWAKKGEIALLEALSLVDSCLRIILITQPIFWVLENPVGRLSKYLGKPKVIFNPCDYGDPYTKRTCLWGNFNIPKKTPVEPMEGSKMWWKYGGGQNDIRSITPQGFAQAFFEANK